MDFFVWSTIILGIWAAIGPLVGVRYGQVLAKRWQKKHWTNDNAKEECRKLLSTLTDSFWVIGQYYGPPATGTPISGERNAEAFREVLQAERKGFDSFNNQLFIDKELKDLALHTRWSAAIDEYKVSRDEMNFAKHFGDILREVRKIAKTFL